MAVKTERERESMKAAWRIPGVWTDEIGFEPGVKEWWRYGMVY